MHEQVASILAEYEASLDRLRRMRSAIAPDVWARRPAPDRWSPAECITHLNLTSQAFAPLLRQGIEEARREGGPIPSRYYRDVMGWLVSKASGPSRLFRTKTAPAFVPTSNRPIDELVAEFEWLQRDHIACVKAADDVPLHKVRIRSPFEARVQYTLFSALSMIPGHQQRHLSQAQAAATGL